MFTKDDTGSGGEDSDDEKRRQEKEFTYVMRRKFKNVYKNIRVTNVTKMKKTARGRKSTRRKNKSKTSVHLGRRQGLINPIGN